MSDANTGSSPPAGGKRHRTPAAEPAGPPTHVARLYRHSRQLARLVAELAREGLTRGEGVVLVMTPSHRKLVEHVLVRSALPLEDLRQRGQLVQRDAETVVDGLLSQGEVASEPTLAAIAEMVQPPLARFGSVRVYGEMVEVLRGRGQALAAERLEHLWHRALAAPAITLLCAYRERAGQPVAHSPSGHHPEVQRDLSSRERLMAAGRELFSTRGFDATTTAAVARLAGTSESQLVKHFGHKDGLLQAVLDDWWGRFFAQVATATEESLSPRERLLAIFDLLLVGLQSEPAMGRLLLFEGRRLRPPARGFPTVEGFRRLVATLDQLIGKLAEEGRLARGLTVETARSALIGAFEGLARSPVLASLTAKPTPYGLDQVSPSFRALVDALLPAPTA